MSVKFQSFWVDGLDDVEITSYIDPKENLNIPKVLQLHVASLHPTPQNKSFAVSELTTAVARWENCYSLYYSTLGMMLGDA